eukprot:m.61706 g.61706  ORF g.61706 m.61706 type:complete len:181 (+) comp11398_c0_seq3:1930-2472(+)
MLSHHFYCCALSRIPVFIPLLFVFLFFFCRAMLSKRFKPKDDIDKETILENIHVEEQRIKDCFQEFSVIEDHMGKNPYKAFEFVCRLIEESEKTLKMTFYRARSDYPGLNFNHLECILYLRHNLSQSPRSYIKDNFFKKKRSKKEPNPPTREEIEEADYFVKVKTDCKEFPIFPEEDSDK